MLNKMNHKNNTLGNRLGSAALSSFAFAAFFTLGLPLQTFLGNSEMFDYQLLEMLPELLFAFLTVFSILIIIEMLFERFAGRFIHLLLITIAVCGYLEAGVLSVGMPQLNGDLWRFCRPSLRQYLDCVIVLLIFILVLVFNKVLQRYITCISVCFIVMCFAFVLDSASMRSSTPLEKSSFDAGMTTAYDVAKSVTFSGHRNIIVLSLDSAPADIAYQIMREDKNLRTHFNGFLEFYQNIGMHDCTTRGIPAIVTGNYLEKNTTFSENLASIWGRDSCLTAVKDAGYSMYVQLGGTRNYTNRRTSFTPTKSIVESKWKLLNYTNGDPFITLWDVLLFRLVPYRVKFRVISKAIIKGRNFVSGGKLLRREWEVYPILSEAPLEDLSEHGNFLYFHTEGVHLPIVKGKNGEDVPHGLDTRARIKDNLHYLINEIAKLLENIKAKGCYDNSLIIITTDHGIVADPKSALLWVKPFESNRDFKESDAPTSHCKIASLIKTSLDKNLSEDGIINLLSQEERILRIRQKTPEKWWLFGRMADTYDIIYDKYGCECRRENLGEFVIN